VLCELVSDKKEFDLANQLFALLNHEPAVYYLLEHRDAISDYLSGIRYFEENNSKKKKKNYFKESHHQTNFKINAGKTQKTNTEEPLSDNQHIEEKIAKLLHLEKETKVKINNR
jgi:hypothetical protein